MRTRMTRTGCGSHGSLPAAALMTSRQHASPELGSHAVTALAPAQCASSRRSGVDAFLGATGCKDAVLVDLCCLPVLAGQIASMRGVARGTLCRGVVRCGSGV